MVSPALRAVSAASTASAGFVAVLASGSGPDPNRAEYIAFATILAAVGLVGHALAGGVVAATAGVSPLRIRSIAGGLSLAAALSLMVASAPYVGSPFRSIILALLAAAAVQAFGCLSPNDSIANGLLGAGVVGIATLSGNLELWVVPAGLLWAGSFAGQLALAHRHELATKISHPAQMEPGLEFSASGEPWMRTISAALVALVVLALLALAVPPLKTAITALRGEGSGGSTRTEPGGGGTNSTPREPRAGGTPRNRSTQAPEESRMPGGEEGSGSDGGPSTTREPARAGEPGYGIDLNRTQEPGGSQVFALVNAAAPRLMRTSVFTVYTGDYFLAPEDPGVRSGPCPCSLPVARAGSVPFDDFDQLVEVVADYEGPLPAAFEARLLRFHGDPRTSVAVAEGGVLLPAGTVKAGTVYSVDSQVPVEDPDVLSSLDEAVPPEIVAENVQLPKGLSDRVRRFALDLTEDDRTPYEKAIAITRYVVEKHRFPDVEKGGDQRGDAVERYLFDRELEGIGDDAVVASVVMMRTVGIPARVGFGYRPRAVDPAQGSAPSRGGARGGSVYVIDKAWRTTWVEFYVAGFGWVTSDIQPLLGANRPPQSGSIRPLIAAILAIAAVALITVAALLWRRSRRRRHLAGESEARSLMRMLEQAVGIARRPSQTPTEFGAVLWARLPNADRELAMLVIAAIVQLSYTPRPLSEGQRARVYEALQKLKAGRRERDRRGRHGHPGRKTGT